MQRIITDLGFRLHHDPQLAEVDRGSGRVEKRRPQSAHAVRALMPRTTLPSLRRLFMGGRRTRGARRQEPAEPEGSSRAAPSPARISARATYTIYRDTPAAHLDAMYDLFVVGSDQVWNPELPEARRGRFPDLRQQGEADRLLGEHGCLRHRRGAPRLLSRAAERIRAHLGARGGGGRGGARADRPHGAGDGRPDADAAGGGLERTGEAPPDAAGWGVCRYLFPRTAPGSLPAADRPLHRAAGSQGGASERHRGAGHLYRRSGGVSRVPAGGALRLHRLVPRGDLRDPLRHPLRQLRARIEHPEHELAARHAAGRPSGSSTAGSATSPATRNSTSSSSRTSTMSRRSSTIKTAQAREYLARASGQGDQAAETKELALPSQG